MSDASDFEGEMGLTFAEAASGKYPCIVLDDCTAEFWCVAEVYEKTGLDLICLSRFPWPCRVLPESSLQVKDHLVDLEMSELGLHDMLCDYSRLPEGVASLLLENGIAPGQPFRIRMNVHYHKVGAYDCEDWDCDYDWDLLQVEEWSPEAVLKAWEEWLDEDGPWRNQHDASSS